MQKIRILPPRIANKIAAGEVVDRPAAVVKELVENAIDAGASSISVVLEKAGKELIQVIDNGNGIVPEDVPVAFERHATSKIKTVSDLDRIFTLGFRGEALPSIASVARVELKTRTSENETGILLQIDGGKIITHQETTRQPGTTISVKNLFHNTPARRNFLRADVTEFNHIHKVLKRFFLAYPGIGFTVHHNNKDLYDLPACDIDERITGVFGEEFYQGLVFVNEQLGEINLEGYVCRPDMTRGNTENQFIFLNKRAIQNRSLNHAVFQGYGNLIERSRHPQFIMYLEIPPNLVDINVHPTKMEARFSNERAIYHLFLSAVRKAIQTNKIVPAFAPTSGDAEKTEITRQLRLSRFSSGRSPQAFTRKPDIASSPNQMDWGEVLPFLEPEPEKGEEALPQSAPEEKATSVQLWQVHHRYILSQIKSGLVIIDQHVAHERILYEKFLNYLDQNRTIPSQKLLFPQTLELALEDYLIFGEIKEWLQKIGFAYSELSGRTILIEAIPADVKVGYEGKVLLEIIDYYRENEGGKYQPHEKIAAAFACKNAIKSGEKLNQTEMAALVDQLFATKEPYFCPHGRPVIVTLNLEEIDKKFKRI